MMSVICVVHPSRVFREGLTSILAKSQFAPTCTASSAEEVPSVIAASGEQVLLLIGVRAGDNLAEVICMAKAKVPGADLVVLGDANKPDLVTTALRLGATSFVDENLPTSSLIKELELLAQGEPVISVMILKRLLGQSSVSGCQELAATATLMGPLQASEKAEPTLGLSGRELTILNALVQGASNKVIAYQLSMTEATVKVHVKAILRKIQVRNRTQAAIWAVHHQALPKPANASNEEVRLTA